MSILVNDTYANPATPLYVSSQIIPMYFKGQWDPTETYRKGDVVYTPADPLVGKNFMAYVSLVDGNTGNQPQTSPADWTALSQNGMNYSGAFDITATYFKGDVVYTGVSASYGKNGMSYVCLFDGTTGIDPQAGTGSWGAISPSALCFNGLWSSVTVYSKGDIVTGDSAGVSGGRAFVSLTDNNVGNVPQTDSSWAVLSPKGVMVQEIWDVSTTYSVGDLVYVSYSAAGGNGMGYVSITDSNVGNNPVSSPSAWVPVSPNGLNLQPQSANLGNWISGNRYLPNAVVFYRTPNESGNAGNYYVCVADNLGSETVPPILGSTSRSFWLPLDSATFVGSYSATARYDRDNSVSVGGGIYQSATDNNVGNAPLINPSSWIAMGYKALRIPYAASFAANVTPVTNTPILLKTISLGSLGTYNYAQGFGCGLITQVSGSFGALGQIRFYLSESATGIPIIGGVSTSNIGFIYANVSGTSLNNTSFDLSRISYCNLATPFSTLYLFCVINFTGAAAVISFTGAGTQSALGANSGSSVVGNLANVSGLEVWKAPVSAAI